MKIRHLPPALLLLVSPVLGQTFDPSAVEPAAVSTQLFVVPEGLEVTVWATSPMLFNPTNMDIDAAGRIWVAEGVRYRSHFDRQPAGDRIVVLEDTNGDGQADSSHTFVQEPGLVAPLGVAVIDNQIVVSQPPELIVYTDVDRNLRFDPEIDTRKVLLTGFQGINHDHSLHSVTVGPDSKWYFNAGNCGGMFTDADGKIWRIGSAYRAKPIGPFEFPHAYEEFTGVPSDDGHVYIGGFTARMNPDATDVSIIGHNYRNSYEQSVNSFGDVFQNDNDDPPACRVSYVMEYANFGFSSNDGERSWRNDARPGQSIAVAQWRQEDPGSAPAGDVYGGGSPTGNVYYENGALGPEFEGMFLACEAGRNVIFGYHPEADGAGFKLERFDFMTSNPAGEQDDGKSRFAGSDFIGGSNNLSLEEKIQFRPSDVAVGPDGALYVSDWYDARVGGHQDLDESCSGTIYRIAPQGFRPEVPKFDATTIEGAITALRSPAVNVREVGRAALRAQGAAAIPAVRELLSDANPYVAVRGIWMLGQLGPEGLKEVEAIVTGSSDVQRRVAAFRVLRRLDHQVLEHAAKLARSESAALRREAAIALRDVPFAECQGILADLARGYRSGDRTELEAIGTACSGKESEAYALFRAVLDSGSPNQWSEAFADLAWRLHEPGAVADLRERAMSEEVSAAGRKQALDALAFIRTQSAADAVVELAAQGGPLASDATWWLLHRSNNEWSEFGLAAALKERGIYDPAKVEIVDAILPEMSGDPWEAYPPLAELLAMEGDVTRGAAVAARCMMCHQVGDGIGVNYGPSMVGWGRSQTREVIFRSLIDPSADIAHGFEGTEILTKDGKTIHGLMIAQGNPKIVRSMGGLTQLVPPSVMRNPKGKAMDRSLMLSASQLGLTAQDLADVVAYLKEN